MAVAVTNARTEQSPAAGAVGALVTAVASVASAACALVADDLLRVVSEQPVQLGIYLVVALALQVVSVDVYGRGSVSFAGVGLLAIAFAFGVGPAMAAGVVAGFVNLVRRRGRIDRGIFDAATLALSAGAAAFVFDRVSSAGLPVPYRLLDALAAAAVFLVVNVGLLTTAMSVAERLSPIVVWNERLRWFTPYYLASGPLALACVEAHDALGLPALVAFVLPPAFMMLSVRQYVSKTEDAVTQLREANDELARRHDKIVRTHRQTIVALSRSIEAKDYYTGGHTERVSEIAVALARRLGLGGEDLDAVEIGALLHDIGKIGVPEHILHKPGPLDEAEWKVMRTHPLISDFILADVEVHPIVKQIARSSHERVDGCGYPDGLRGDDIPLAARIALVADAFDALTSDRPYRPRQTAELALAEIRRASGTQCCPKVVAALEQLYEEEPELLGAAPVRPLRHVA